MRVQFGEFIFDSETREVRRSDVRVHLTPKAFALLEMLIGERPRAIRKEELRDRLWPNVVVEEANLKNLVVEIRGVLGPGAVRTVHGYGYAFDSSDELPNIAARLVVEGARIQKLKAGENVIGRDDDCSVMIDVAGVSRHHAKIRISHERVTLEDLGSKNGTWKNDERVNGSVELRDGDRIRIGRVSMTFRSNATAESTVTIEEDDR